MITLILLLLPFVVAGIVILYVFGIKPDRDAKKIVREYYKDRENGGIEEGMHKHFYKENNK